MIAKIGRSSNLYGALAYNQMKVQKEKGQILFTSRMIETPDGIYSTADLARSFEPFLLANRNTEKPALHISLNPDPHDNVSDDKFIAMAQQYMQGMGYAEQPFAVFKHTDIDRTHVHIVTVCVDEAGRKISDKFEKRKSMAVCRELERKYVLVPATEKGHNRDNKICTPVDFRKADIKSQIASVVRSLPHYYQFQTLGEYNALLSLFNITAEKTESHLHGKTRQGLLYIPLDENGQRAGHPLKASLFGRGACLPALDLHFATCKEALKHSDAKSALKEAVILVLQSAVDQKDFKMQLAKNGINTVVRANDAGRIYGITFIDHNSRTVWNGSRLGKEFSANGFNDRWANCMKAELATSRQPKSTVPRFDEMEDLFAEKPHRLFDFPNIDKQQGEMFEAWAGILPDALGDDFDELALNFKMKKRRRAKKYK